MNPWNDPVVVYLRAMLGVRVHRLRTEQDRSLGASAIEWAIITGVLAAIAIAVYGLIWPKIRDAANNIDTKTNAPG